MSPLVLVKALVRLDDTVWYRCRVRFKGFG